MDEKHLSKRLTTVASYVPAGARMADIGSDHAYLPAALALTKKISYAVAGEVVTGPYKNAVSEIKGHGLTDWVKPRLADGLDAVTPADRIDTVVIAGMGGTLIAEILERGKQHLAGVQRLVLQPNVGEDRLRRWLMVNRYQIMAEQIVGEDDHIYEVIVAEPSVVPFCYSDYELMFGPHLLEEKGPVFVTKWQDYAKRQRAVINQIEQAQNVPVERITAMKKRLALVAEALGDDKY